MAQRAGACNCRRARLPGVGAVNGDVVVTTGNAG